MELELKFAELACCEPVGDLVTTQEESMETAIPEYCPDIARIVDTVGQLRLREKHPAGQQLTMGGSVVLTVLYTSEESAGLRSLSMEVPFSCQVEDKRLAAWEPQTVRAACGLPQMQITGSTCRLSVPVRFEGRRCLRRPVAAVTAVELQDPPEGPQPSLILRRMAEGETLWDIARQYRTDEEAIRAANELTEDRPEGMLLIPRVR